MKTDYSVTRITKKEASDILLRYHYLKDISKGFKSGFNYGLIKDNRVVGVIIFSGFPVPELSKGLFGLERDNQEGLFELSRLCIEPVTQALEYNITSWFVSRAIRALRKDTNVRAILSYADTQFHEGTIYKACNFTYYGMTTPKKDFWIEQPDGSFVKHSRGTVKGVKGEWRSRSRKHRYLLVYDKELKVMWEKPLTK